MLIIDVVEETHPRLRGTVGIHKVGEGGYRMRSFRLVAIVAWGIVAITCTASRGQAATFTPIQKQAAITFVRGLANAANPCLQYFAPKIGSSPSLSVAQFRQQYQQISNDCRKAGRAIRVIAVPAVLASFPQFYRVKALLYDLTKQSYGIAQAALKYNGLSPTPLIKALFQAAARDEDTLATLLQQIQHMLS